MALLSVMVAEGQVELEPVQWNYNHKNNYVKLFLSQSCCGDLSMSRQTRDLNQNIEHATSFLTLFGSTSLNLRLSNLSSLASACIGFINGDQNILNSLPLCHCACQAVQLNVCTSQLCGHSLDTWWCPQPHCRDAGWMVIVLSSQAHVRACCPHRRQFLGSWTSFKILINIWLSLMYHIEKWKGSEYIPAMDFMIIVRCECLRACLNVLIWCNGPSLPWQCHVTSA